jgi:hypothetical protein
MRRNVVKWLPAETSGFFDKEFQLTGIGFGVEEMRRD